MGIELNDLLNGINAGLSQGLDAYTAARERQRRDQASQEGLLSKGMQTGPNGQVQYNPQMQAQQQYERDALNPNSEVSQRSRKLATGLLQVANPEAKGIITDDLSAHEIENNPFINKTIQGSYGMQGRQISAQKTGDRTEVMRQGLLTRQDTQAAHAADTIHNDKRVVGLTQQLDQLERGRSILDQPNITNQEFNDYQQEIANAISGASGGALGKLERTEYTTAKGELAALKQKITGKPEDAVPPEIVARLKNLADHTRDMMARHRETRAESLRRTKAYQHNPAAQDTMDEAIQNYKTQPADKTQGLLGVKEGAQNAATSPMEDEQAISWAKANPKDPRAQQIMQLHQGR